MTREQCDGVYRGTFEECRADGRRFQLAGRMACQTCVLQDRCNQDTRIDQLEKLVFMDELTGVPNRRSVRKRFNELAAEKTMFAVALLDLNSLNAANNNVSHAFGDTVLTMAGQTFALAKVREADEYMVGRFGGDEFVALARLQSREAEDPGMYTLLYGMLARKNEEFQNLEQIKNYNQTVAAPDKLGVKYNIVIWDPVSAKSFEDIVEQIGPKHTFIRDCYAEHVDGASDVNILSWAVSTANRLLGR